MPYTYRIVNFPANGKARDLNPMIVERANQRNIAGFRCSVGVSIAGTDVPEIGMNFSFANLAELQAFRAANATDTSEFFQKVAVLTSRPPRFELNELILPVANLSFTPKFLLSTRMTPALGLMPEVRAHFEEMARAQQSRGQAIAVAVTAAGTPQVIINRIFPDLAALEAHRAGFGSDPDIIRARVRFNSIIGALPQSVISEILVPFPPAN